MKLQGLVIHNLMEDCTGTSRDEVDAFRHCGSISFLPIGVATLINHLDLLESAEVLVATSTFNPARYPFPAHLLNAVASFPGLKVVIMQDEHSNVEAQREWIEMSGASIVLTCSEGELLDLMYPSTRFSHVVFVSTLPGYVPSRLENVIRPSYESRPIDLSYRGRVQGFQTGELGQDKHLIGDRAQEWLTGSSLRLDVDSNGSKRVHGESWDALLRSSKAALAAESGTSIVDWDGSLSASIQQYLMQRPNASFGEVRARLFPDQDWKYIYRTASPRIFEYAANGCLMVLAEGHHSGIVEPWTHYVPLARDGSNVADVVDAIKTRDLWERLTERAWTDLIRDGAYSWRIWALGIEKRILEALRLGGIETSVQLSIAEWLSLQSEPPVISERRRRSRIKDLGSSVGWRLPVPLRRRIWSTRSRAKSICKSIAEAVSVSLPWLVWSRSSTVARQVQEIMRVRQAVVARQDTLVYLHLESPTREVFRLRISGVRQITHGYEAWLLSRKEYPELAYELVNRRSMLSRFHRAVAPMRLLSRDCNQKDRD